MARTALGRRLTKAHRLALNQSVLAWSRSDPDGLLAAARTSHRESQSTDGTPAERLMQLMTSEAKPPGQQVRHGLTQQLLEARPEASSRQSQILNTHRDEIVTDHDPIRLHRPRAIGGYLDRDLPTWRDA